MLKYVCTSRAGCHGFFGGSEQNEQSLYRTFHPYNIPVKFGSICFCSFRGVDHNMFSIGCKFKICPVLVAILDEGSTCQTQFE